MYFSPGVEKKIITAALNKRKNVTNQAGKYQHHYSFQSAPIHSLEDSHEYEPFLQPKKNVDNQAQLVLNAHIGEAEVCMTVDTRAKACTMSTSLMDYLGLRDRLEDTFDIVDSGKAFGEIENVMVTVEDYEMKITFLVTDSPDNFLVFGIDQLKNHGCVIDMSGNNIKFGGIAGKSVKFMQESEIKKVQSHLDLQKLEFGFGRACA